VALSLLEHFIERTGDTDGVRALLERAFLAASDRDISGAGTMGAYVWKEAGTRLASTGSTKVVAAATCEMVLRSTSTLPRDELGEVLLACATVDAAATWEVVQRLLESPKVDAEVLDYLLLRSGTSSRLPQEAIEAWVGRDRGRALRVVAFVSLHGESIPPLARTLLSRFGPESPAADHLLADLLSPPRAVDSLAAFTAAQLERVTAWRGDADRHVADFAKRAEDALTVALAQHRAQEERQRRRRTGS
jgi:hypothetical protein